MRLVKPAGLGAVLLPLVVVLLVLASMAPAHAAAVGATVTVTDHVSPANVTIAPGQAVQFVNNGTDRHRMRSSSGPEDFDTGDIEPGASAQVVLTVTGTYEYEDHRNDHDLAYFGTIIVTATPPPAPGPTPPPAPGPTPAPGPAPGPTTASVSILDKSFSPASTSISAGSTVAWTNVSDRDHTVTANGGAFDSGTMAGGASFSRT
ncbi:MAG: hypothetical protein OEU32_10740, partial [Acidimicrobiia bacterium]|nr:hypothetical protein [Acidimicrobiia bacterium]